MVRVVERLGASDGFATLMLSILVRHGWDVSLSPACGQEGWLVTAAKMGHDIRRVAPSKAEAALAVLEECSRRIRLGEDVQLPLPIPAESGRGGVA